MHLLQRRHALPMIGTGLMLCVNRARSYSKNTRLLLPQLTTVREAYPEKSEIRGERDGISAQKREKGYPYRFTSDER